MQQAEDGERGYLITQDPALPGALPRPPTAALPGEETNFARLVADNPSETAQVRDLIGAVERRRHIIERVVATAQAGDFDGARAIIVAGQGRAAMSEIERCAEKVNAAENRLLVARTAAARNTQALTLAIGLVGRPRRPAGADRRRDRCWRGPTAA